MMRVYFALLLIPVFLLTTGCEKRPVPPPQTPARAVQTIFDIIADGDTTAFLAWLESTTDLDLREPDGSTPLIAAVMHNRLGFVLDLIGQGAQIDAVDEDGNTAVHIAAMLGHTSTLSLLIESGADTTVSNKDGLSAYDLATLLNQPEAAIALAEARQRLLAPLEPDDVPVDELAEEQAIREIPPALLLSTDFRVWTSASGDQIDAAFIQNIFEMVVLQNREGDFFRIPLNRLSPADQITVRQLSGLDPHILARARGGSLATSRTTPRDSLALRIGRESGWTVLENCRLVKSGGNDGDSFYVRHDGKDYIFRLYFVDAAETSMSWPDRVRHQADYFGLNDSDTIKLGHAATKFTLALLGSSPFTVVTRWEDAKGNSRLPRHFALVVTPQGDLDELLVREGLVRRYGMIIRNSLGQRKQATLKRLEQEAKEQRAGAWSKQATQQAAR